MHPLRLKLTGSYIFQMSMRNHAPSTKLRPLPPLPLLFSPQAVAGNVRLLREGQGAEWCHQLELGACGLDRAMRKDQVVKLEVEGTGYFSVILRTRSVAASLADPVLLQFVGLNKMYFLYNNALTT